MVGVGTFGTEFGGFTGFTVVGTFFAFGSLLEESVSAEASVGYVLVGGETGYAFFGGLVTFGAVSSTTDYGFVDDGSAKG